MNYEPDVYKMKLNPEKDKFIILATDGLWDFLKPQEAVDIVANVPDPDLVSFDFSCRCIVLFCVEI